MSIHFQRFDARFCGSLEMARQFSTDENTVTCKSCKDRDCLTLSEEGRRYVNSIMEPLPIRSGGSWDGRKS